jgi:cbb3-type cytochrome oxidase subunit 1
MNIYFLTPPKHHLIYKNQNQKIMAPATIFQLCSTFVLIGWILLIFAPNRKMTQNIVLNGVVLVLSFAYLLILIPTLSKFSSDSFSSLENVKALFQDDMAVALGWVHYLAFDLFVGAYIISKGKEIGMARWQYTLCLPFTFMLGPIGYLLFTILKQFKK